MKLQIVPAHRGAAWVKLGIRTFFKQPLGLIALSIAYMVASLGVGKIPLLRFPLGLLLLPIFMLCFITNVRQVSLDKFQWRTLLSIHTFFKSIKLRLTLPLMAIIYAIAVTASLGISALVDGGNFARVSLGMQEPNAKTVLDIIYILALCTFVGLQTLLSFLFYQALTLIHWQAVPIFKAIFFSIVACLRNFRALLVFALLWLVIAFALAIIIGVLALVCNMLFGQGLLSILLFTIPGFIVILSLMTMNCASIYFVYLDFFEAAPDTANLIPLT